MNSVPSADATTTRGNAPDPADILARTIWAEARNQGRIGMEAVASVIMNRARNPGWWGSDVVSCCQRPYQFSCWNPGDLNRAKLLRVTGQDPEFATATAVARDALAGRLADRTHGADSYANLGVCSPDWADPAKMTCQIGDHTFFRIQT
jgi:N-acetylmuramoyl-L-alanine amidase